MVWTTDKPLRKGFYWYRCVEPEYGYIGDSLVVWVSESLAIEQGGWHVSELDGEWAGPLEPPSGPVLLP